MCFSYKAINIIIITQKTNFNMIFFIEFNNWNVWKKRVNNFLSYCLLDEYKLKIIRFFCK